MLRDSIDYKGTAVGKLFRRFLFPTVMGMVFSAVFVITDGIFVGRGIGSDALAAVNLTAPLFTLGTGLGLMFGMGGSVVASVNLAQGKRRVAQINITQSLVIPALLIALLSALLIHCHKPLLLLLGTPPELMVPAREYLVWFTLFLAPLAVGGHITLLGKIPAAKILLEAMAVVKPTIICCVPMILEKVYRKQVLPMLEKGPMSIAMKIPLLNSAIYSVIRKKLMDAFGGNVGIFIVGGAPMNQETESFLMKIKFPITIGYGMTECAPLISFTPDNEFKAGSCGRFLKGLLEVRIDSEDPQRVAGEILVRGEHVMKGYYKNDKDTHKVLDEEGWLHTGDMATMDPDGTLYIRGRSKTMILSGNGQNIYPEEIEDKLNNMYLVLESLVLDAGNGKIKALVVPDYEQAEAEGVDKADLPQIMQNNLQELNAQLAAYEHRTLPQRVRKNPETKHQTLSIRTLAVEQIRHRQVTNWILYPKILHSH